MPALAVDIVAGIGDEREGRGDLLFMQLLHASSSGSPHTCSLCTLSFGATSSSTVKEEAEKAYRLLHGSGGEYLWLSLVQSGYIRSWNP